MAAVNPDMKKQMNEKISLALNDIKSAEISKSIENVKQIDNKITAEFSVSGLQVEKSSMHSSESPYRRYQKIFDTWEDFSSYAEEFFDTSFENYE